MKKLEELREIIKKQGVKKKLVLAVAQDEHSLGAVSEAVKDGLIDAILVGKKSEVELIAQKQAIDISKMQIIDEADENKAVEIAVKLIGDRKADVLMKGNVASSTLLKGVLNKEWGLRKSAVLSHFAIFEVPTYHKILGVTDAAMNTYPELKDKIEILKNSVELVNKIGVDKPKVAVIGAVEVVNLAMQPTIDAAIITKMNQRGQIKNCIVDGPFALDNAINKESADHKKIISEVAGDADILLLPNIDAGNVLYKALGFLANAKLAAVILGAKCPIVLTSRSDSEEAKLFSIMLGCI